MATPAHWLGVVCDVRLALILVAIGCLVLALRRRSPGWADQVVNVFDVTARGGDGGASPHVSKIAIEAAIAAKVRFGELRYNNANRVIVSEFVREHIMALPDIRKSDVLFHAPMATELALLPTEASLLAQRFAEDALVRGRRAAVALPK